MTARSDAEKNELIEAISTAVAARLSEHPPQCKLGLDPDTVTTLKELAAAWRSTKKTAWLFTLKLLGLSLIGGLLFALAKLDVRGLLGIGE